MTKRIKKVENEKDSHLSETRYERFLKDQSLYGIQQTPKILWSWKSILLAIVIERNFT